jgi:hypothetical protein
VIQALAYLFLAHKTFVEDEVGFILEVRHFQRHDMTILQILGSKVQPAADGQRHRSVCIGQAFRRETIQP